MVNTAVPALQNIPAKNALNGKLPTTKEYINCNTAVMRALRANISRTCRGCHHTCVEKTQFFNKLTCPCVQVIGKSIP